MILIEHNYPLYIAVWFLITVFMLWYFRFMSRKMKDTDDRQTKSSLFTLTVFLGIPMLLIVVIGPLLFIIGDKNLGSFYRYVWILLMGAFLIYFIFKQRTKDTGNE